MSGPEDTPPRARSSRQAGRPLPVIFGCSRPVLLPEERAFFKQSNPFGFILFARNCEDPEQVKGLIKELRFAVGREDAPILIDQEGGRVSRLQPPHWPQHPAARAFGAMYERDADWGAEAMQCYARLVAHELVQLGFTVNCAPVVDLLIPGASSAIGDRALSRKPAVVAALARLWAETFLAHGILPVIKHFPGHGRLKTDPHLVLPIIDATRAELESDDFMPFELLKDLPIGMNSHAVFMSIDPRNPASLSVNVHQDIIRGTLGFDGLLLSDDLNMKALSGTPDDLARKALEAGSDVVLHCNGRLEEMKAVASALGPMKDAAWARWEHARAMVKTPEAYDPAADNARLDILLGGLAWDQGAVA
ncbi:MAG: beta-N-acetylhexosaminidase [Alphaproteobacteria bacterium]|nr:beta-N-acetylhexosaminidase [Alphaproteobacteria bacterium]